MARDHVLRMGRRMPFDSSDGVAHANSFWCLDQINIDADNSALRLKFIGYHDETAYDAGKQAVAGAEKHYLITDAKFQDAVEALTVEEAKPIREEILRIGWNEVTGVLDVEDPENAGEMISFFASAEDVA